MSRGSSQGVMGTVIHTTIYLKKNYCMYLSLAQYIHNTLIIIHRCRRVNSVNSYLLTEWVAVITVGWQL